MSNFFWFHSPFILLNVLQTIDENPLTVLVLLFWYDASDSASTNMPLGVDSTVPMQCNGCFLLVVLRELYLPTINGHR